MKLIECPRDAMQGIKPFISTELKASYINSLLNIGFDTIDFGSFVSPKAMPQMKDTEDVLKRLNFSAKSSKLLGIIANKRGAEDACKFDKISYLGFPFSISETFQLRNTNASIEESLVRVEEIQLIANQHHKEIVIYLSMGFGNPYNEEWNLEIIEKWTQKLAELGINIIAFSDTIGVATPESISYVFSAITPLFPHIEFGVHLHSTPDTWYEKIDAAWKSGCRRFDSALKGYGGCPMATDKLTGNIATENILDYFNKNNITHPINVNSLSKSLDIASHIFQ